MSLPGHRPKSQRTFKIPWFPIWGTCSTRGEHSMRPPTAPTARRRADDHRNGGKPRLPRPTSPATGSGPPRALLDVALPMIAYFAVELCGASAWVALGGSIAVIAARLAWLITRHELTRISMLSIATFIATAALVTLTGNRWLFLLKPVIAELTVGITALV